MCTHADEEESVVLADTGEDVPLDTDVEPEEDEYSDAEV